jgi:hypothetical protein
LSAGVSASERRSAPADIARILDEIARLPKHWHAAGPIGNDVLRVVAQLAATMDVRATLETGSGKSTLLFSWLSPRHTVFSLDDGNGSIARVRESPLLRADRVDWVEGPSQRTLPAHRFAEPLQIALLDGPHGFPFPILEYYHVYPHLAPGAVLIVDDIQVPAVQVLHRFLDADEMFERICIVGKTAFFRRTNAPTFDPHGDMWWTQGFNRRLHWADRSLVGTAKWLVPTPIKNALKRALKQPV